MTQPARIALIALFVAVVIGATMRGMEPRCTIVTDGSREVYIHEVAHCLGWTHEPFTYAEPPKGYVHAYSGRLTVIKCGRKYACKSVAQQCSALWANEGKDMSEYRHTSAWKTFNGCQVFQ